MPLRIFSNISNLNAQRSFDVNSAQVAGSIERIASGIRVLRASDDIASFSISEGLRSDVRVLRQAEKNGNDGIALMNVAEGGLAEISSILIRMRELATQSSSGTLGGTQRQSLQLEFDSLKKEINRISSSSEFNGQKLIDGSLASDALPPVVIAIGRNSNSSSLIDLNREINLTAVTVASLGIDGADISTQNGGNNAIGALKTAVALLAEIRGRLGATQNSLVREISNLQNAVQNLTEAGSKLRDADISLEVSELTRNQILMQTSVAMVGQSNLNPRLALQLLQ